MPITTSTVQPLLPTSVPNEQQLKEQLFAQQANRIAIIHQQIDDLQAELAALQTQILQSHEPGTYQAGALTVTVKAGAKRLNLKLLAKDYPISDYPELYEDAISTKCVRAAFAPNALEPYLQQGNPTVVVS